MLTYIQDFLATSRSNEELSGYVADDEGEFAPTKNKTNDAHGNGRTIRESERKRPGPTGATLTGGATDGGDDLCLLNFASSSCCRNLAISPSLSPAGRAEASVACALASVMEVTRFLTRFSSSWGTALAFPIRFEA